VILEPRTLEQLAFNEAGLLPAVAQDIDSGEVLMVAWMNLEAVRETLVRRRAVFWSRRRQRLWEKGEQSGHTLELVEVHADCDRDTLLLLVRAQGPACHEGTLSCFADRPLTRRSLGFFSALEAVIDERLAAEDPASYTRRLVAAGRRRIAQKVGEEGVEVALAAAAGSRDELVGEAADLLFHLAVLLRDADASLQDVADELQRRHAARSTARQATSDTAPR